MEDNFVIIVQARLGSTRLPGKILKPLNGSPVLEHVLARCASVAGRDRVICAGVDLPSEAPVRSLVNQLGFEFFAGDECDVLSRYYYAAKGIGADWVIRVTSDCPLLEPTVCRGLIELAIAEDVDYAATEGWPHGLDCEITRFSILEQAHSQAVKAVDREHVTLWIRNNKWFKKSVYRPPQTIDNVSSYRWVVDYAEDYALMQQVFTGLDIRPDRIPSWQDVLAYLERHPELLKINRQRIADWSANNQEIFALSGAPDSKTD